MPPSTPFRHALPIAEHELSYSIHVTCAGWRKRQAHSPRGGGCGAGATGQGKRGIGTAKEPSTT